MRRGKWRATATKTICIALRVSIGLFLRIFGFGLWLGKPLAAGLAQFFFVQHWEHVMVFQLRPRTFLLTTELLEAGGGNCRRARAVFVQRGVAHSAVGLARFCLRRASAICFCSTLSINDNDGLICTISSALGWLALFLFLLRQRASPSWKRGMGFVRL
jgi:hypothetical protein